MNINGLPVFNAVIGDYDEGMLCISLVDLPAVESNFLAFAKQAPASLSFAVQQEEKRLVCGVVMRADFPIYRETDNGEGFYVVYSADTIRQMAEKYLVEGRQNAVDLMHDAWTDGVHLVQYYIKDTAKGINPAGFEDIADGSLFAEFHIENDAVWEKVKDGTFRGFSLEGRFSLSPAEENAGVLTQVSNLLKNTKMGISKLKRDLAKLLARFEAIATDNGVIVIDRENDDYAVGDVVYLIPEGASEDERVACPDGEYTLPEGKVIVVADGKISEIRDAVAPADEPAEGEGEGEPVAEVAAAEEGGEDASDPAEGEGEGEAPEAPAVPAEVEDLLARVGAIEEALAALTARLEAIERKPAAESARSEFRRKETPIENADRRSLKAVKFSER